MFCTLVISMNCIRIQCFVFRDVNTLCGFNPQNRVKFVYGVSQLLAHSTHVPIGTSSTDCDYSSLSFIFPNNQTMQCCTFNIFSFI